MICGVIIDKHLSWDKQIDTVCLNITRKISLLKLLSKYIDKASMNTYYNSSIGSVIGSMTSQNGSQDGRHGSKMAAMTSRSRWV